MAPIRVGFIGLSTNSSSGWGANGHFPCLSASPHYEITALCNSSLDAAKSAIREYKLPSTTKAYDNPSSLAADPNVDLVVCSVRVDRHYDLIKPAVLAGKDCFVEWPLGANLKQAEELETLAKEKGIKTVVGLQGRRSPIGAVVQKLIEEGKIGKVLSSTVLAYGTNLGGRESESLRYFLDKNVGGNMVTITFAHVIDLVTQTLGEFSSFTSLLGNQRPTVDLVDKNDNVVESNIHKTSHDQVLLQGTTTTGAVLSFHLRGGKPFKDTPAFDWRIYGQKGEIRITGPNIFIFITSMGMKMELHDTVADTVTEVDFDKEGADMLDVVGKLPPPSQNVGRLYEKFAKGDTEGYPDWKHALFRHRMIEEVYRSSDEKKVGKYL
ncbi:MAG: transcription regulator gal80 [Pycnora praestabilis]|nr:MAG: transcription regulator gal80 [Pycnora praestabilis]